MTPRRQLLNHPHLSAHIDETDEDALSYMTDLEVGETLATSLHIVYLRKLRGHNQAKNITHMTDLSFSSGTAYTSTTTVVVHKKVTYFWASD